MSNAIIEKDAFLLACKETLEKVQSQSPLVHNITNLVVTNTVANILLALGASPLMAHDIKELDEIVSISSALVINIGTLDSNQINSMKHAFVFAKKAEKARVLDPVGAGASKLRTQTALELIEKGAPHIVRANSSEIIALAKALESQTQSEGSRGVDASDSVDTAKDFALKLARACSCVVSVSGEKDFITDGIHSVEVYADLVLDPVSSLPLALISKITGMGCSCSAITGACKAVQENSLVAAVSAMAIMKAAQVKAIQKAQGPASLQAHIIDNLYTLKAEEILQYIVL